MCPVDSSQFVTEVLVQYMQNLNLVPCSDFRHSLNVGIINIQISDLCLERRAGEGRGKYLVKSHSFQSEIELGVQIRL